MGIIEAANGQAVDDDHEFYFARGGNGQQPALHTDPGCYRLSCAKNVCGTSRERAGDWRTCSACSGEEDLGGGESDFSFYNALAGRDP